MCSIKLSVEYHNFIQNHQQQIVLNGIAPKISTNPDGNLLGFIALSCSFSEFIYLFIYTLFYVDIYNKKHKT